MTQLRRHRCWSLLPLLAWLGVQSLMAAGMVVMPSPVQATDNAPWDLGTIVICAANGPIEIAAVDLVEPEEGAPDDEPEDVPADTGAHADCAWCIAFGSVDLAAPGGLFRPADAPVGAGARLVAAIVGVPGHQPADAFESRAPPA
ncbi:MAG: DUF2946 family protein [Pseudomonadota bacterium]